MNTDYIKKLKQLSLISDLISYEGPVVSLLTDKKGNLFIYKWCGLDKANHSHKWLIFAVSFDALQEYISQEISELDFIEKAINNQLIDNTYLIANINDRLDYSNLVFYNTSNLPNIYKSQKNIYFDADYCDNIEEVEKLLVPNTANLKQNFKLKSLPLKQVETVFRAVKIKNSNSHKPYRYV